MKTCPTCRRTYEDDGLNFCLEDGSVLTFAPRLDTAAPTVVMDRPQPTAPAAGMDTTWDTKERGGYSMQPKKKSRAWLWVLGILGIAVILCGGGVAGFFVYVASVANNDRVPPPPTRANSNASTNVGRSNSSSNSNSSTWTATGTPQQVDLAEWVKENSPWGTTEFKDGEFLMAAKQKGYYYVLVAPDEYQTKGAVTRVIVRNPDGVESSLGYGLIVHSDATPLEKDYAFLIDSKRRRFRVVRHEPEKELTVTAWTNSRVINEGTAENTLEVRDRGTTIELYINGQLATTVTNKQGPTSGVPGLYAGDGAKIGFKKLEIIKAAAAE
jgi:hypothetical protein